MKTIRRRCRFRRRKKRKILFNFCLWTRESYDWLLRCCRELAAASDTLLGESPLLSSVLIRLILRICSSSFTADCGILKVLAQSRISWTVISTELRSCVLLVKSSSKGSSLMLINSSTCWWSSLRVMVIGTWTTEVGVVDGGTICVLLVIMIESLALRFFKLMFCCFEIGVIVISLFSISLRICWAIKFMQSQKNTRTKVLLCARI